MSWTVVYEINDKNSGIYEINETNVARQIFSIPLLKYMKNEK